MIFIVAFITALIWHFLLEKLWLATIGSTLTATLLTLALAITAHYNPYSDKLFIDILQMLGISFVISILIGFCYKYVRNNNAK